jgi:hypothetical protein
LRTIKGFRLIANFCSASLSGSALFLPQFLPQNCRIQISGLADANRRGGTIPHTCWRAGGYNADAHPKIVIFPVQALDFRGKLVIFAVQAVLGAFGIGDSRFLGPEPAQASARKPDGPAFPGWKIAQHE